MYKDVNILLQAVEIKGVAIINVEDKYKPTLIAVIKLENGCGVAEKIKYIKNTYYAVASLKGGNKQLMLVSLQNINSP